MAFDITSYILAKKELEAAMEEVPHLNESGKIPAENLPSYVDDIENGYLHDGILYEDAEFTKPIVAEEGKIYVDLLTNFTYRWSGEAYVRVNEVDLSNYYTKNEAQAKIDAEHKLSANLIEESTNKKFVSEDEKTVWGNKYNKPNTGIPATDLADAVQTSLGKADSAVQDANYVHTDNNFDATYKGKVDDNTVARHNHSNKELLDTYAQTEADLADAVSKKHNHANKSILDGITSSDIENWNGKADEAEVFKQVDVAALPVSNIDEKTIYKVNSGDPNYYFLMLIKYTDSTKTEVEMTYGGNFLFNIEDYDKDSAYIQPAAGWPWGSYDHPYIIKKSDISYDDDSDVTIYREMDDELYNFSETENAYMKLYTHAPEHFYDNYDSQTDIDNCNAWVASQGPAITIARYIYLDNTWINFDELVDKTTLAQEIADNSIVVELNAAPSSTHVTGTLTSAQIAKLNKNTRIILTYPRLDMVRNILVAMAELHNLNTGQVSGYIFSAPGAQCLQFIVGLNGEWDLSIAQEFEDISNKVTSISSSSTDSEYPSARAVYQAIDALPEPMVFQGSLGTGGTITALPAATTENKGFVYKVITDGTYASQAAKVGDVFISNGSAWVLVPSGDEPSGTVTNVAAQGATGSHISVSGSPITSSGTLEISVDSGYSIPTDTKQTRWDNTYTKEETNAMFAIFTTFSKDSITYAEGNIVSYLNILYVCISGYTTNSSSSYPNADTTHWAPVLVSA